LLPSRTLALLLSACSPDEEKKQSATSPGLDAVKVTGELKSANARFFGPPALPDVWNYTIAFMAPDGTVVKQGTPILRFDTQELMTRMNDKRNALNEKQKELEKARIVSREQIAEMELQIEEARAVLDKAILKADIPESLLAGRDYQENQLLLKRAQLDFELRQEELAKEKLIQVTEVEILEREAGILQAELDQLQNSISNMTVLAPGDGVVIHATDRRNNKLAVGDNVWMGRRVLEFPDLSLLEAHLEIPERDSARVHIGQEVVFTLDAIPDKKFLGEIVELASVIHTRSESQPDKVFDAKVLLRNPDTSLMRPGMSISALIEAAGPATQAAP